MEQITRTSSAWRTAERLVSPIIQHLPPDTAFDFLQSLEVALSAASDPPAWLNAKDAVLYCKWRWKMSFTGKDRPPFRPLGQSNYYRREEIDAWAMARIEARPAVPHV